MATGICFAAEFRTDWPTRSPHARHRPDRLAQLQPGDEVVCGTSVVPSFWMTGRDDGVIT
jgi:hypothetical protein